MWLISTDNLGRIYYEGNKENRCCCCSGKHWSNGRDCFSRDSTRTAGQLDGDIPDRCSSSVNKQYSYTVNGSSTGYKIECVFFNGGDDSVLLVTTSNGESYKSTKESYKETIYVSGGTVTITFSILGAPVNFCARGTINYA